MPIESSVNSIFDLNALWPTAADPKSDGDDHLRMIKSILKITFPAFKGVMPIAHDQIASKDFVTQTAFSAALPGQAGNAGKVLYTDGTSASWQQPYPDQTSNAGKFFTTDGTNASWSNMIKASVIRFADGTDVTKLAAFDLSGLTTGTTRTYALPDASGTLALRSDTAMQLVAQATVGAAVANIDFLNVFTAAYDKYVIDLQGLVVSASSLSMNIQLANAGAVDSTSVYNGFAADNAAAPAATTWLYTSTAIGTAAGSGLTATIEVRNANSTAVKTVGIRGAINLQPILKEGSYTRALAVSGFRLLLSAAGNFTAGTIRIYGIKNS